MQVREHLLRQKYNIKIKGDSIMYTIECLSRNECCGCSSCVQRCPKDAIKMVENEEGFLYPTIDKEKCINCGLCYNICPQFKKVNERKKGFPKAYALRNKNENELLKSSSGGFFSILANYIIEKNGAVFGAAYDENLNVRHIKATTKKDLSSIRGSKYVQSTIGVTYKEAKKALEDGQYVLFTGTPCQISGLKSYLNRDYEKLITADLVCHGVPSQKLFKKYLEYLSLKYKSKVVKYNFRSKEKKGWSLVSKIETADGRIRYREPDFDPYYNNFLKSTTYRENCYQCKYANYNRVADFTMADFWGISKMHPNFFKESGNSLVLINNEKANQIIELLNENIEIIETNLDKAASYNKNLLEPSKKSSKRSMVYKDIDKKDAKSFIKENLKCEVTLKKAIKAIVPQRVKKVIKKIIGG